MERNDDIIKQFIEAALKAKQGASGVDGRAESEGIDRRSLERIARDLGMSDEDIALVRKEASGALEVGERYLSAGLFDEAEAALDKAADLMPWDPRPFSALARVRYARACSKGCSPAARRTEVARAAEAARNALAVAPGHDDASRTLAKLAEYDMAKKAALRRRFGGLGLLGLAAGIVAFLVWLAVAAEGGGAYEPSASNVTEVAAGDEEVPSIPVEWDAGEWADSLDFEVELSRFQVYDSIESPSWAASFNARIAVRARGFTRLDIRVRYIDSDGAVVKSATLEAISDYTLPKYSGETISINNLQYEKGLAPKLAKIAVSVSLAKPVTGDPPGLAPVDLGWDASAPEGVKLDFGVRGEVRSEYGDSAYDDMQLVFKNSGSVTVSFMKVRMEWYRGDGTMFDQYSFYLITDDDAPLRPGETRSGRAIRSLPPGSGKGYTWRLFVEEARFGG
jgi:hypothetical protein